MQCQCTAHSDIHCHRQPCASNELCQPSSGYHICKPASYKTCTVSGGFHFTTFDERFFRLPETCAFILSNLCWDNAHLTPFTVISKMEESRLTSGAWPVFVKVIVYEHELTLPTGRPGHILVNGVRALIPASFLEGKILVFQSGFMVTVRTDFGVIVSFDGLYHVTTTVPQSYFSFTCGVCGTPKRDPSDDLQTRNDSQAASFQLLAERWREPSENSTECQIYPVVSACSDKRKKTYSRGDYCGIIADTKGPFRECTKALPSHNVLESCVQELCASNGTREVLCHVLTSYVQQCQAANITVQDWRKKEFCEATCPENSVYSTCGTACPATCTDPEAPQFCAQPCRESCLCKPSYILGAGVCVPVEQCGCTLAGRYYTLGEEVLLDDHCTRKCACRSPSRAMECEGHSCGPYEKCTVIDTVRGCHPAPNGTCRVWGGPHYHTYDGLNYTSHGACRYTLTRSCGHLGPLREFSVEVENVRGTSTEAPRAQLVEVQVYGHRIAITAAHRGSVQVNGSASDMPIVLLSGLLRVHLIGSAVVVEAAFGIVVSYDWNQSVVEVTVPGAYSGVVCGLCGDFNGIRDDDFRGPSGSVMEDVAHFVKSWQVSAYTAICAMADRVPACGMENVASFFAKRYCGVITDPEGPFTRCDGARDNNTIVTDCVYNMCISGDSKQAFCSMMQSFAQQCQKQGTTIQHWRDHTECEMTCPKVNTHYELCGSSCPATCSNRSIPSSCPVPCEEGCQCDHMFVLNGTDCIPVGQCGCSYNNRHYLAGETWRGMDCLTSCRCNKTTGIAQCSSAPCAREEDCVDIDGVFECQVPPEGHCQASKGTHYSTFDGTQYSIQSNCAYILSELCSPSDYLTAFSVEVKGDNWVNGVPATTVVSVWAKGYLITLERGSVKVDGVSVTLPITVDGGDFIVYKSEINMMLKTKFGLTVIYDTFTILVNLHSRYRNKTCGLCGNFNQDASDDFATQNGTLSNDTSQFVIGWKVEGGLLCSDGCDGTCPVCQNEEQFKSDIFCHIIKNPSGPFSLCHQHIHPDEYFSRCLKEQCLMGGDNRTLCLYIQTYAAACQTANVTISSWRNESFCALACPDHSHYDLCGNQCQASCATSILGAHCTSACSEGCFCNEGYRRSGDDCVPATDCGCEHQGRYYKVGDLVWLSGCTRRCHCDSPGALQCVAATCNPGQSCLVQNGRLGCFSAWATCSVTGDPHYITYDGALAHFQGTCAYEVTRTCRNTSDFSFRVIAENRNRRSPKVSFVSHVEVQIKDKDSEINVTLGGSKGAQVNGEWTALPNNFGTLTHISKVGNMLVLSTSKGMEIRYRSGILFIRVNRVHQGQLCGMCGNFNWDPDDDKVLPTGELSRDDIEFGNSWRSEVSPERCSDEAPLLSVCQSPQGRDKSCDILTNRSGPFSECHWHEDPAPFYASCKYDICHHGLEDGMLCEALASYEEVCKLHGVMVPPWRALLQCPEEDPCEPLMCTGSEWCGERNGEFGCFCYYDYDDHQKANYDMVLSCAGRHSQVSLSRCLLFTYAIQLNSLHLEDKHCTGTLFDDRLLFTFDSVRRTCGTQVEVNITHTTYNNLIQDHIKVGGAVGRHSVHLPFSCAYSLTVNLIPPRGVTPVQTIVSTKLPDDHGLYKTTMLLYQDPKYRQHFTQTPIQLSVDNTVYAGLSISGANPTMFVLTIAECWATASNDSSSGIRWDLITNQCPNPREGQIVIEEDGVSTIGRFSFSVFKFIDQSKQVYLHCKVQLCRIQEVACTRKCGRTQVTVTEREEKSPTMSIGPIEFLDEQNAPAALQGQGSTMGCSLMLLLVLHWMFLLLG
ncbi:alpha-tectorin-like [Lissotriton helveticus]